MLWRAIQPGDVVFTCNGPWVITSVDEDHDEFGRLCLNTGETGTFFTNPSIIVRSPIVRDGEVLNLEALDRSSLW